MTIHTVDDVTIIFICWFDCLAAVHVTINMESFQHHSYMVAKKANELVNINKKHCFRNGLPIQFNSRVLHATSLLPHGYNKVDLLNSRIQTFCN